MSRRNYIAALKPHASFDERLLDILKVGGPRKVAILAAWAIHAGCDDFVAIVDRLVKDRKVVRGERPTTEDSGPYLTLRVADGTTA